MLRDFKLYLNDILEASRRIQNYIKGMCYEDFEQSDITIDAVVLNLEVIGEAARKLPAEVRSGAPEIEWRKIVALRNILSHEYFGVSTKIVWDVIQNKLESLGSVCRKLLE